VDEVASVVVGAAVVGASVVWEGSFTGGSLEAVDEVASLVVGASVVWEGSFTGMKGLEYPGCMK